MTIALIGGFVFVVFVIANALATRENARVIQAMQEREFPIIENLTNLKQEAVKLRKTLEDAIAYENDFLIMEGLEQSRLLQERINKLKILQTKNIQSIETIEDALASYTQQAAKLAEYLVEATSNLDELSDNAQQTNQAFEHLHATIHQQLAQQQKRYADQLILLNANLRDSTLTAAGIGFLLLIILFGFTYFIMGKIMSAVKRADTLREAFLTTISHELRTPLTGIYGTLNLLNDASTDAEREKLIALGQTASRSMNKLVDDIILFAELMSGQNHVINGEFNIAQSLGEAIKLTQAQCEEKGLIFECKIEVGLINSDERKITRTLRHLLENAVKYTEQGHVRVHIFEKDSEVPSAKSTADAPQTIPMAVEGARHATLVAVVEDTGPGIKDNYLANIFSPFEQGDSAWNRTHQGMGLGLPMSHLLINSLQGRLDIWNRKDLSGVHAEVAVPCLILDSAETTLNDKAQPTVPPDSERPTALGHEGHNTSTSTQTSEPVSTIAGANAVVHPRSVNALIVEDNKTSQLILQMILKKQNVNTQIANNGSEALDLIKAHRFDIVFMDCQMPVMDGFEATEKIRNLKTPQHVIPIIAVTANTRDTDKQKCFAVGMDDFLEKPVNLSNIERTLEKHLNKTLVTHP